MKTKQLGLALLFGILLAICWPPFPLGIFLLFALVPLLILEEQIIQQKQSPAFFLSLLFVGMLLWHLICHHWFFGLGAIAAMTTMIINSLMLSLYLMPAHLMKRNGWTNLGHGTFIASWMSFDLMHLNWDLSYPLLNLGNGLAYFPAIIQWYEFTGVFGGSLWILGMNVLSFRLYQDYRKGTLAWHSSRWLKHWSLVLVVPILFSVLRYVTYQENERDLEVVVVHPNIDTRSERYVIDHQEIIDRYVQYSKAALSSETDYLVWTENALTEGGWLESINQTNALRIVRDSFKAYPKTNIIAGSIMYGFYSKGRPKDLPPTVTYAEQLDQSYYSHSAAIQIDPQQSNSVYRTKQQLVPFEESAPYPQFLTWLRNLVGNYTGFTFSPSKKNQHIFSNQSNPHRVTPLICYESAFGSITGQYTVKGAEALFVMLNEGWYHNWQGASQFLYFSVLRAIETRRSVARSSNDGISGFISPRGDIITKQSTYEPTALRQNISTNKAVTVYARLGDYLGWLALLFALGAIFFYLIRKNFSSSSVPAKASKKRNGKNKKRKNK